jgi:hypothetical protein
MPDKNNLPTALVGISLIGCAAVGILGIIFAVISVLSLDWIGAGVCLTASGLSFGLLVNAVLRS